LRTYTIGASGELLVSSPQHSSALLVYRYNAYVYCIT